VEEDENEDRIDFNATNYHSFSRNIVGVNETAELPKIAPKKLKKRKKKKD
jgi:hypothetical protein